MEPLTRGTLFLGLLALLASSCFEPTERDGVVACGEGGACPPGFECDAPSQLCYRDPPGGGAGDGGAGDGGPDVVDGAPIDAPGELDAATDPPQCANGLDDDCDGLVDFPDDPGCADATDDDEHRSDLACDDGDDNDGDGKFDFRVSQDCGAPGDPGCANASSDNNENPVN